ncbi:hypothetical protein AB0K45_09520 [Micrococcus luteus]|uniref:hypothetical protein n=1 Tax=Micrococcus luteus TaxID=1270 RepID=UPI00341BFC7C
MPLPNFTVSGNLRDILDVPAGGELVDEAWTDAYVIFAPNIKDGVLVYGGDLYNRPRSVKATVNDDGDIEIGGQPVELLANDPGLNVTGIQWRCDIKTSASNIVGSFWFDAPADGGTVDLAAVAHVPSTSVQQVAGLTATALLALLADEDSAVHDAVAAIAGGGGGGGGSSAWADITGKPSTFPATATDRRETAPTLYQDFTKQSNASGIPSAFDSGHAASTVVRSGTNAQQYLSGGKLRSTPTNNGPAAAYYRGQLSAPVRRIGARWTFIPHSATGGTMCFAAAGTAVPAGSADAPAVGLHVTCNPTGCLIGYSTTVNGSITNPINVTFTTPLPNDGVTELELQVAIVGTTLYAVLPDGRLVSADWSAAIAHVGAHVFFEHFANDADSDNEVAYSLVWADSGQQRIPEAQRFLPWRRAFKATTNASISVPATTITPLPSEMAVGAPYVTAPPSGKLLVRVTFYAEMPNSDTSVLLQIAWSGTTSGNTERWLCAGFSGTRELTGEVILDGLTPGGIYALTPAIFATAAMTVTVNVAGFVNGHSIVETLD